MAPRDLAPLILAAALACAPPSPGSETGPIARSASALVARPTLPRQEAGVYRLAEWMRDEDCAGTFCDVGPAFARAMADSAAHPVHVREYVGGRYLIPAGEFADGACLEFPAQSIVEGEGGSFWGARTILHPPKGCTAFKLVMGGSELRDFALVYAAALVGSSTVGVEPTIGVDMAGRTSVERLWIRGPTVGVVVGDANVARVRDLVIDTTDYAGVIVGPPKESNDANASLFESVSVVGPCRRGDRWAARFGRVAGGRSCAGVIDRSFLGNLHLAHHGAGAMDLEALAKANAVSDPEQRELAQLASLRAAYDFDGKSAATVALGLYAEGGDKAKSYVGPLATAIGGASQWTGPGLSLRGNVASSLVVLNDADPLNRVELRLGAAGGAGTFLELKTVQNKASVRFKEELAAKCVRVDVNNSGAAIAGRIYQADGRTAWKP